MTINRLKKALARLNRKKPFARGREGKGGEDITNQIRPRAKASKFGFLKTTNWLKKRTKGTQGESD